MKFTVMRKVLSLAAFISLLILPIQPCHATLEGGHLDVSDFERLAIQAGGRIKPFDTFAREAVQLITGSSHYEHKNPSELVLSWLFMPDQWSKQKFFQIKHLKLKQELGIPETESYVSPEELAHNTKLPSLFTALANKQKNSKHLDPYDQAVLRVNNQMTVYQGIISGDALRFVPQEISDSWLAISELKSPYQESFRQVATSYFGAIVKGDVAGFKAAVTSFKGLARSAAPQVYPSEAQLEREILYNRIHPFRTAYILYFLTGLLFVIAIKASHPNWRKAALTVMALGLLVHASGFVFRCLIAGRPPVSNMYESIIWVALGCALLGFFFEIKSKRKYVGLAACCMSFLALLVGDSVPAVLDQSIRPLEPVLRSNFWLTIHVLTITLSYAPFTLACGIGDFALWPVFRGREQENKDKIRALATFQYRCVQVGVLLLTAGTILGGVWADYSWGRFWGWDPKETWALIADLGYLAVLHGRFAGWLSVFGSLAATVFCYTGVIMAWYGVNFVLGQGLHSYGFGTGGVSYVASIVGLQWAYLAIALRNHMKNTASPQTVTVHSQR